MTKSPLKTLWRHFRNKRFQIIKASLFSILNKLLDIAPPMLIGLAVDTVVRREASFLADWGLKDPLQQIYILGVLTFVIWVLESLTEFLFQIGWRGIAQEVQHELRLEVYDHLQKLPLTFFDNQRTGNLTTIINDDVNQLERFLDGGVNDILQVLTTVFSIGTLFFFLSPGLAALSFIPIPLILIGSFYFQKKIAPRYSQVRSEAGFLSSTLVNNLSGIMTIKSYVAQEFEKERLTKQSLNYVEANKQAIHLSSAFSPIIRVVILCGFLVILVGGGRQVFQGTLEVAAYSTMVFMIQRLLWPLTRLGAVFDLSQRAMASTKRVLALLEQPLEEEAGEQSFAENQKGIALKAIKFSYEQGSCLFSNLSLSIPHGQTVALVGTTGSGKSTLLKLLLRFYELDGGTITCNGVSIKNLDQSFWRRQIGFVSQEPYLFHGTVAENIIYGSFHKKQEEIEKAAGLAEAHEFIQKLPQGYQTIVGERGQKLSGGQRQRLAIARAILKDPKIFVFDEATSAIDNETEAAIQRSLKKITKNRTTIIVAHRLSTIRHAHRIYVLEEGKVQESGNHEELIAKKGSYASLWKVQTGDTNEE